ncbi:Asp23/Gls24 family envelope stress response protein [Streptomyces sp. AP-93]|uniref:Asp23/Gls24 family envelope stress response protein n=1 Tax=Streptomyces sp. AP-93 TaxID=2929048 RepID=UPI001FAEF1E1|nr:Asp23/Gls24 family envelope stress response protein [Streptomyces sp. AP-93]MCJ0872656.1 Asp23/Gls24 family envelope stress response protein [Streptomyces sp. AP-93]
MAMNEPYEPPIGTAPGAGGKAADEPAVLPCGRDLAALWDREEASEGPRPSRSADPYTVDPHPAGCPHCAAAREDLARLRESVRRDLQESAPDWEAAASRLTAGIMDVVRLELRPGRTLALGEMDEDAWIYEAVAARTFRHAAELVPGVRAGSCRISPAPDTSPGARTPARTPARVRIEVTAAMDLDLLLTADRIRRHITQAAHRTLGMQIFSVEVVVTDLHHEAPGEEPR